MKKKTLISLSKTTQRQQNNTFKAAQIVISEQEKTVTESRSPEQAPAAGCRQEETASLG